jgi:hypothetical protein
MREENEQDLTGRSLWANDTERKEQHAHPTAAQTCSACEEGTGGAIETESGRCRVWQSMPMGNGSAEERQQKRIGGGYE